VINVQECAGLNDLQEEGSGDWQFFIQVDILQLNVSSERLENEDTVAEHQLSRVLGFLASRLRRTATEPPQTFQGHLGRTLILMLYLGVPVDSRTRTNQLIVGGGGRMKRKDEPLVESGWTILP
jgi:hypothetical protein